MTGTMLPVDGGLTARLGIPDTSGVVMTEAEPQNT